MGLALELQREELKQLISRQRTGDKTREETHTTALLDICRIASGYILVVAAACCHMAVF